MQNPLRNLPSVNQLLETPQLNSLVGRISHNTVVSGIRTFLEDMRSELANATSEVKLPQPAELADRIAQWIKNEDAPRLRPVVNATGVLLHTGLGRAPLAAAAVQAINDVAGHYASVEVDLRTGERSQRVLAVQSLLCELTGAEAAVVVNNNAAATLLTLTALAKDKEVIVSRGELIEIGGSFRLPDVMTASGARLREVGTTNKTRASDFEQAINEHTAALMRVHTSNFVIVGFTEQPSLKQLLKIGAQHRLPVIDDIGSGALIDLRPYGLLDEPIAAQSVRAGADLVLFSGDKLLGGPQCGIIVGKREHTDVIAKHPLMRALRVDKTTLAALAATLRLYRDEAQRDQKIPLLAQLSTSIDNLKSRAERLAPQLAACPAIASAEPLEDRSMLGGGSVPTQQIPTWCVALEPADSSVDRLAGSMRAASPSIFGRVQQNRLLLDLRTVFPDQDLLIVDVVSQLAAASDKQDSPPPSG